MKFFAIYTNVILSNQPKWLDDFRKKYDEPHDLHITLKQPCYINEIEEDDLKENVSKFFSKHKTEPINVEFSEIIAVKPNNGDDGCIMINASPQKAISNLQKELITYLSLYKRYKEPHTKIYEENFKPHITIGHDLNLEGFNQATQELPKEVSLKGVVDEVIVAIVADDSESERKNLDNLITHRL